MKYTYTINSRSTSWAGWFGIGGVSLRVVQRNSDTERITLIKDGNAKRVHACGNNAPFVYASQGREVLPS